VVEIEPGVYTPLLVLQSLKMLRSALEHLEKKTLFYLLRGAYYLCLHPDDGGVSSSETWVRIYQTIRYITEGSHLYTLRRENLKSYQKFTLERKL
jgi:hypothetical protein